MRNVRRRYRAKAEEFEERVVVPLLWILARGGPHGLGLRELAHATMVSTNTLNRRLLELRKRGLAIRTDKGRWVSMVMLVPALPLEAQAAALALPAPVDVQCAVNVKNNPPEPPVQMAVSQKAIDLGKKLRLPPFLHGSELHLGPIRPCVELGCRVVNTPIYYGLTPVCRQHAEAWVAVDQLRDAPETAI